MKIVLCIMAILLAVPASAEVTWRTEIYDSGPKFTPETPAADLILPMNCGGAMAFQRIDVFVDGSGPLADKALRHGDSSTTYGYRNFLRQDRLRGPFIDDDPAQTYFYMARYELTQMQYLALTDPTCNFSADNFILTIPQTEISWFAAHELGFIYTKWLNENAAGTLPNGAYLRLPTEVEWEFAARGGEAVDNIDYQELRPPMDDQLTAYIQFGSDSPGPVGIKKPNPLHLFDMFGNAEEIMFEPFRMNGLGSFQGHIGGMVTRGGSYLSSDEDLTSAARFERSFYNSRSGLAQAPETVGMRLVIGAPAIGQFNVDQIDADWRAQLERGNNADASPISVINDMISISIDPVQTVALEDVLLSLTTAQQTARDEGNKRLNATLQLGTTILWFADFQADRIAATKAEVENRQARIAAITAGDAEDYPGEKDLFEQTLPSFLAKVDEFEAFLSLLIKGYHASLSLLNEADFADFEQAYNNYTAGLALGDSSVLLPSAEKLRDDFVAFRANPTINEADFRALVTE